MKKLLIIRSILIFFLLAIPLFGYFFTFFSERMKFSLYFICIISFLVTIFFRKKSSKLNTGISVVILRFNILYIVLILFTFLVHLTELYSEINIISLYVLPFIISLSLILLFSYGKNKDTINILEQFFFIISVFFLIQFLFSFFESYTGIFLREYGILTEKNLGYITPNTQNRYLLSIINLNIGLKFPVGGLLGTHNYWGAQLPFYNIIFLCMYHKKKNIYYLFLLILVFSASILNTSRFAISAILLTDSIYYLKFVQIRRKFIRNTIIFVIFIIILLNFYVLLSVFSIYFSKSNTLSGRIRDQYLWITFFGKNIFNFIIGFGPNSSEVMSRISYTGAVNESLFFIILYKYGIIGFSIFIWFILKMIRQGKSFFVFNKYISYFIVLNIILISLTVNNLFDIWVYPFVTILFIYNVLSNQEMINYKNKEQKLI